jgi:OmpA-OmpF porin, OOP family
MRNLTTALMAAVAVIATPAIARDGAAYVGVEFGAMKANDLKIDVNGVEDAVVVEHEFNMPWNGLGNTGWDGSLFAGYDFGGFRLEAEASRKRARIEEVQSAVVLPLGAGPGTYAAAGQTRVSNYMLNGMLDLGDDAGTSGFIGAGVGYAKVGLNNFRVFDNAPAYLDDSDGGLAWQVFAGLRQALGENLDVHVKYRYFNAPGVDLDDGLRTGDMKFSSHSLLGGLTLNFGRPAPAPVAPPPPRAAPAPVAAPPPPPQTRTCPDGSVRLVTEACPAPPAPVVAPRGERG